MKYKQKKKLIQTTNSSSSTSMLSGGGFAFGTKLNGFYNETTDLSEISCVIGNLILKWMIYNN